MFRRGEWHALSQVRRDRSMITVHVDRIRRVCSDAVEEMKEGIHRSANLHSLAHAEQTRLQKHGTK